LTSVGRPASTAKRRPLSRRQFLTRLGLGAGAVAVGGLGISELFDDSSRPGTKSQVLTAASPLRLGAQTYSYADFTDASSGRTSALLAAGIVGQGSDRTIIDLTGPILTEFPLWHQGETTHFNVARIEPAPGLRLASPVLSGFTLRVSAPTVPGALFNGLRIARSDDLLIEDVRVLGVPGTGNLPPFETFGIDVLSCARPVLRRVVVDGQSRGGAGIGINTSTDALLDTCTSSANANSHGFACYQSQRVTFINCNAEHNGTGLGGRAGVGFNHEESDEMLHIQSRAIGNSLASFRFLASGKSTTGHRIIRSFGDGAIILAGNQSVDDISVEASTIDGGFRRA
jgi:hypothetical protein